MTIYSSTNYRKIYEQHFGPIPKDENGRTYEIHHIDGNHSNNDPANLKCVTIQEHYDIHYSQGDWAACLMISNRAAISPEEKSYLSTQENNRRVENGTHPFLGGELQRKRVADGTHNLLGGAIASRTQRKLVEEGRHQFLGDGSFQRGVQHRRVAEGLHNFAGEQGSKHSTALNLRLLAEGRHPSQNPETRAKMRLPKKKVICPHCSKQVAPHLLSRFHGDKCRKLSEHREKG